MGRVIVFLAEGDAVLPAFEAVRDMIAQMGPPSNGQSPVGLSRRAERAIDLDRPCRISGVIDELEMSRTTFDRAVGREEFTVKGEFVELTP